MAQEDMTCSFIALASPLEHYRISVFVVRISEHFSPDTNV